MVSFDLVSQGDIIIVLGKKKKVVSKVKYISEKAVSDIYYKIIFDDHSILVGSLDQSMLYYGSIISPLKEYSSPFPESIIYNSENYQLQSDDYQIVLEVCFGNPLAVEGEVHFADYVCRSDSKKYISLALVSRTGERADVYAKCINLDDLELEQNHV